MPLPLHFSNLYLLHFFLSLFEITTVIVENFLELHSFLKMKSLMRIFLFEGRILYIEYKCDNIFAQLIINFQFPQP